MWTGKTRCLVLTAIALLGATSPVWAQEDDVESLRGRVAALEARIAELEGHNDVFLTRQDVEAMLAELQTDAGARSVMPAWMENLQFYGDLRLRYQTDCFNDHDHHTRNRLRYRLRFGFKKTWLDGQLLLVVRLASGEDGYPDLHDETVTGYSDPTSTNQSFDTAFTEKPIWIDRVYVRYTPDWLQGLTLAAGKMPTPFFHTSLTWDPDINPEGLWAEYRPEFGSFSPFASVGYWVVQESSSPGSDVNLWTFQLGSEWQITEEICWTVAGTYCEWVNYAQSNVFGFGNHQDPVTDAYVTGFRTVNITNELTFEVFDVPVAAYFDWVHNCAAHDPDADFDDQRDGYAAGLHVGTNRHAGDWSVSYKYAYVEANCTPGFFADSDFGNANRRGHVIGVKYNLTDFLVFATTLFYTEPIRTGSFEGNTPVEGQTRTTVKVDLIWSF